MIPDRSDVMRWTTDAYERSPERCQDVLRHEAVPALIKMIEVLEHYEKTLRAYASPGSFGFEGDRIVAERALRGIAPDGSECRPLLEAQA